MKILTIDDRPELAEIGGYFDQENEQVILTKDSNNNPRLLYDVAHEVKQKTPDPESDEKCVIFLNLFLECRDDDFNWQQDQAGIALLKFLRMMGVHQHVVLISPYSFEHLIQQDAGNYIVASKGLSFVEPRHDHIYSFREFEHSKNIQTPKQKEPEDTGNSFIFTNSFAKYLYEWMDKHGWIQEKKPSKTKKVEDNETVALHELADNTFDVNNLTEYLKSGFELPADERHNWSNWWGIIQLCDVHRSTFPGELNFGNNKIYPRSIDDSLKSLRNFQVRKLYQTAENFQDALASRLRNDIKEDLILYGYEVEGLEESIQQLKTNIEAAESSKVKNNLGEELKNIKSKKNEWINERKKSEKKLTELNRVIDTDDQNITEDYINELRFVESESKPQVLYIDDQGHEGWSDIFQIMLYGQKDQPDDVFKTIHEIDDDIFKFYTKKIKSKLKNGNGPDIILLDLRLLNESGTIQNVHEISGAKLLGYIREDFPGQPIMMTTASNKAWSVKELSKIGVDFYWTKEGIDISTSLSEQERDGYTLQNYLNFLEYIKILNSEQYQFLNRFGQKVKEFIETDETWWWKNHTWNWPLKDKEGNFVKNDGKKKYKSYSTGTFFSNKENEQEIYMRLEYVVSDYRIYLKNYFFSESSKQKPAAFENAKIIQSLGNVVEAIHAGYSEDGTNYIGFWYKKEEKEFLPNKGDYIGWCLWQFRNKTSHVKDIKKCKERYMRSFLAGLLCWLYTKEYPKVLDNNFPPDRFNKSHQFLGFSSWNKQKNKGDAANFLQSIISETSAEGMYNEIMHDI